MINFCAAEDANRKHGGIDYLETAVLQKCTQKKGTGASTITQQVARNFLLTSDNTPQIKEVILARQSRNLLKGIYIYT